MRPADLDLRVIRGGVVRISEAHPGGTESGRGLPQSTTLRDRSGRGESAKSCGREAAALDPRSTRGQSVKFLNTCPAGIESGSSAPALQISGLDIDGMRLKLRWRSPVWDCGRILWTHDASFSKRRP